MSDLRKEFERRIKEDPSDILTRHAYADWLDENTDEAELATFHRSASVVKVTEAEACLKALAAEIAEAEAETFDLTDLIEVGRKYSESGTPTCVGSAGFSAEEIMEDKEKAADFWQNWSMYTGTYYRPEVRYAGDMNPFSCCI